MCVTESTTSRLLGEDKHVSFLDLMNEQYDTKNIWVNTLIQWPLKATAPREHGSLGHLSMPK